MNSGAPPPVRRQNPAGRFKTRGPCLYSQPMSDGNADAGQGDEALFEALLTPHRSLGRTGLFVLVGFIFVLLSAGGLFFLSLGAWPVFGFFGLDIAGVALAFWLNVRSGRTREEIRLSRTELTIRKVAPSGRRNAFSLNPFWARFSVRRHAEIGIVSMRVSGRGRSASVGSFLNPADRESFAAAFSSALASTRS